ncbi:hypothetical protein FNL37_1797 [Methylovorus glucosotrophus]|uniref:hypothetical protein n=1 Tax=Methylovorus glucosotrophus TaxID=266009 RepID=UPI00133170CF|nr:hypothetical protein [Methylovorus glucosotrophus]KAF0844353.1 hypothetical protein FNL37_1797 [Methylovorus glucosotrophus]
MVRIFLLIALLTGCASADLNKVPEGMRVKDEKSVSACEFKGEVNGISSLYGLFAEVALSNARKQAFAQAAELGANTIVWKPQVAQYGSTSANGNAYRCP